jgi:hypothetical protein
MSRALLPPKQEAMVDDDKFTTLNWNVFFEGIADGDAGTVWVPTFTGLTETGTATKTGKYYRISKALAYYRIVITPATDTSAVSGTTYCNNFPLTITNAGVSVTLSSYTAAVSGVTASDKRIYTATWTNIVTPVTLVGILEIT